MTPDELKAAVRAEYASSPALLADRHPNGQYKYVPSAGFSDACMDREIREVFETAYETIAPYVPDAGGILSKALRGDTVLRRHLLWLESEVRAGRWR